MSRNVNQTYAKPQRNGLAWIAIEVHNTSTVDTEQQLDNKCVKLSNTAARSCGFNCIPLDDQTDDDMMANTAEDIENAGKRAPKGKSKTFGLSWVPFGENSVNVDNTTMAAASDQTFQVPQRMPPKLKKKLTPSRVTPVRRSSLSADTSLRRQTFKVTPRSRTHLHFIPSATTTKKKRRSSGSNAQAFTVAVTPRNRSSLRETFTAASTPSTANALCLGVEEIQYLSWINVMLASKGSEGRNESKIDSNQLIIDCFNSTKMSLSVCPTKDQISAQTYREAVKWNQLRSSAAALYRSKDIQKMNRRLVTDIKDDKFAVRKDRAIHADIGVRKHILDLLLSYNPLWLRIGLETLYNTKIEVSSISFTQMRLILGKFIANNLLESKELMAKYGHKTLTHFFKDDVHVDEAKKYILIRFLSLLNFLDVAKQMRLIEHNPCLFRLNSQYKTTFELLRSFARDYITGVGDITKYLRNASFSMAYNQTAIEEFDFEANNLAVDLRCGIRLARLAELTTDSKQLLSKLLFPANNITRKLHNVEVALKAFKDIVPEGIVAKDIVSGHRKKTFQLLDAIIFKHKSDMELFEEQMYEQTVVFIQRLFRANRQMKVERQKFETLKQYVIVVQRRFRRNLTIIRDNRLMREEKLKYEALKSSVIFCQRLFRANRMMIEEKDKYKTLKHHVITCQRIYRAKCLMRKERQRYEKLRHYAVVIQRKFRQNCANIRERRGATAIQSLWRGFITRKRIHEENEALKSSVVFCQRLYRANRLMIEDKHKYQTLKLSIVLCQRFFRANRLMRQEKLKYVALKSSVIFCQRLFRANRLMKEEKEKYKNLKESVIFCQRLFRANQLMIEDKHKYESLKSSTVLCQRLFRANQLMRKEKCKYEALKSSVVFCQRLFRANRLMIEDKHRYESLKLSTILCQRLFRANRLMKKEENKFKTLKASVVFCQRLFRANRSMAEEKHKYQTLKLSTVLCQRVFRANRLMREEKLKYEALKSSVVFCQRLIRANRLMKEEKEKYENLKESVIFCQRLYRANRLMFKNKHRYESLKSSTVLFQRVFRANRLMREEKFKYETLKSSVVFCQRLFRANRLMTEEKHKYQTLKLSIVLCQRVFRANRLMREEKLTYETLKSSVVFCQRLFRANRLMKEEKEKYENLKETAIFCQRLFRANRLMIENKHRYESLKLSTILCQRLFRANRLMKEEQNKFKTLKTSIVFCQRLFRANRLMAEEKHKYQTLKLSTVLCQRVFRANRLMKEEKLKYETLKSSVVFCQRLYRANRLMKVEKEKYDNLKELVIFCQRLFRANRLMIEDKHKYESLKSSTILCQRLFRANRLMREDKFKYETLKSSVVFCQRLFRANRLMTEEKDKYKILKYNVITCQRIYRAKCLMRKERQRYENLRHYAVVIQRKFRENYANIRERRAAIAIQSLWRGFITRKRIHEENEKIERAFQRILTSTSLATEDMQLGNRTHNALQKLLSYDSLLHLAHDLDALDRTTRLSPESCETLVIYDAIRILLQILKDSNRSEPHKQIISLTVNILLNISKYDKTYPNVISNQETIEVLFKIIKNFGRSAQKLISKCFTLLWILLDNERIYENVTKDKRKMDTIKQISDLSKKDKEFKKYKMKTNYKFCPNWQFGRRDVHEFDNHLFAIQMIAYKLKIN